MLQQLGTTLLKRRLMTWMLGRVQPEAPVLLPFVRLGLLGLAASITGGLLFTLGCVGMLAALYLGIVSLGLAPALALLIVSFVTFIVAMILFLGVHRGFKNRVNALQATLNNAAPTTMPIDDAVIELPRALLSGFLQGILGERNGPHSHTPNS